MTGIHCCSGVCQGTGAMTWPRWVSLAVAALYVVSSGLEHAQLDEIAGIVAWLAISLGCIWWGDELGEGLVGARFGLVSSTSPGWAVTLMGWVLLLLPAGLALFFSLCGNSAE